MFLREKQRFWQSFDFRLITFLSRNVFFVIKNTFFCTQKFTLTKTMFADCYVSLKIVYLEEKMDQQKTIKNSIIKK